MSPASQSPTKSVAMLAYNKMPADNESKTPMARIVDSPLRLKELRTPMPCNHQPLDSIDVISVASLGAYYGNADRRDQHVNRAHEPPLPRAAVGVLQSANASTETQAFEELVEHDGAESRHLKTASNRKKKSTLMIACHLGKAKGTYKA